MAKEIRKIRIISSKIRNKKAIETILEDIFGKFWDEVAWQRDTLRALGIRPGEILGVYDLASQGVFWNKFRQALRKHIL